MRPPRATTDLPVLLPLRPVAAPGEFGLAAPRALFSPTVLTFLLVVFALSVGAAQAATGRGLSDTFTTLARWAPLIFSGFLLNLGVSVMAMVLGTVSGVFLGLGQVSPRPWIARSAWAVTQFFRNAPWLVLLFYAMLILPFEYRILGVTIPLPAWFKAVIGLALPVMANVSEIVRGGIGSIPSGQWESAEALAFSRRQTLWMIIIPQAIKRMLPPWMNLYAILTMATTLISVVGVQDGLTMTRAALIAEGRPDLMIPMYLMLLAMFFAYCYPIARWTGALERRVQVR